MKRESDDEQQGELRRPAGGRCSDREPFREVVQAEADRRADRDPPGVVRGIGLRLFDTYNLPFQIIGILVLVATIGVVVLSKRELR